MPVVYNQKSILTNFDISLREIDSFEQSLRDQGIEDSVSMSKKILKNKFSHPELVEQILHFKDPSNFEEFCKLIKIRTKEGNLVPFKFKRAQKVFFHHFVLPAIKNQIPVRIYILKARQIGFSTLVEAILYWSTSFFCNMYSHIVSHDKTKASEIFGMTKLFYKTIRNDFKPQRKLSNRHELYFANPNEGSDLLGLESKILVETAENIHVGAGSTIQCAHLSEFARYESVNKQAELGMVTLMQAIPKLAGTMLFLETTAYGEGLGKKFWEDNENGFKKLFVSWVADENYRYPIKVEEKDLSVNPDSNIGDETVVRDYVIRELEFWYPEYKDDIDWLKEESLYRLAWRRGIIREQSLGNSSYFKQEYPLSAEEAFISSGVPVFNREKLSSYLLLSRKQKPDIYTYLKPKKRKDPGSFLLSNIGELKIFEHPKQDERYFIGVDIGAGITGGDYSEAQVLNSEHEQVAVYSNIIEPDELAFPVFCLALYYNKAEINPEANAMGLSFIAKITKDLGYWKLYRRRVLDSITNRVLMQFGFFTSSKTKPFIINLLRSSINEGTTLIRDEDTVKQMIAYQIDSRGRFTSPQGQHDDKVMAYALALKLIPKEGDIESLQNQVREGSMDYYAQLADRYQDQYSANIGNVFGM